MQFYSNPFNLCSFSIISSIFKEQASVISSSIILLTEFLYNFQNLKLNLCFGIVELRGLEIRIGGNPFDISLLCSKVHVLAPRDPHHKLIQFAQV